MLRCLLRQTAHARNSVFAAAQHAGATGRGLVSCASIDCIARTGDARGLSSTRLTHSDLLLPCQSSIAGVKSFASEVSGDQSTSKPIKKGLSAGTIPAAAEQVPPAAVQQKEPRLVKPDSASTSAAIKPTYRDSARVGQDRPSASAIPAGVDQIPPSSHSQTDPDKQHASDSQSSATRSSSSQSQQSMQSVLSDISDVGKMGSSYSTSSSADSSQNAQEGISTWQRFKWWIWGTPEQYWTDESSNAQQPQSTAGSSERKATQRSGWLLGSIFEAAIMRTGVIKDEDVARFASKAAAIAVYTLAGFSLLGTLGVDTKPLVAGLGVGGFTVGFALRDVATNFVSGVLLVLQRPFEKGNVLRVHAGSTVLEGVVQSIELRYIVLKPKDQSTVMIPASIVYANPVVVLKQ